MLLLPVYSGCCVHSTQAEPGVQLAITKLILIIIAIIYIHNPQPKSPQPPQTQHQTPHLSPSCSPPPLAPCCCPLTSCTDPSHSVSLAFVSPPFPLPYGPCQCFQLWSLLSPHCVSHSSHAFPTNTAVLLPGYWFLLPACLVVLALHRLLCEGSLTQSEYCSSVPRVTLQSVVYCLPAPSGAPRPARHTAV